MRVGPSNCWDCDQVIAKSCLCTFRYSSFSLAAEPPRDVVIRNVYRVVRVLPNGTTLLAPVQQLINAEEEPDEVYTYSNTLCHWAVQIMHMSDTALEGDVTRIIPNLMANIPLFFSHSHLSKYFVECMGYIIKVKCASPQMASRLLEGSFVNPKGGVGKNCEADLRVEHSVRDRKKLIDMLGANKTDAAIGRVTDAADTIADITEKFDTGLNFAEESGRHTTPISEDNERFIQETLHHLKPFDKQPGRKCAGFNGIKFVYDKIDKEHLTTLMRRNVERILAGLEIEVDDESDVEDD